MPILDYVRWTPLDTGGLRIVVPPFHTGDLGLIPRTELRIGLRLPTALGDPSERLAELHVTPFHADHYRMFRLQCLLWDRPGVVRTLLEAISHHGINIIKEDSCQINAGKHHYLDVILDWSSASGFENASPSTPRDRWLYRCLRDRVPIEDKRYIDLLESVLVHCWNDLVLDRAHVRPLPSIRIQPFSGRKRADHNSDSTVVRAPNDPRLHVSFLVQRAPVDRLRAALGYGKSDRLPYLLASDGTSRTLRVLIPGAARLHRMTHVAFRHNDEPGSLAAIGDFLKEANFNIVTSLLRQEAANEATWELLLEAPPGFADQHFPVPAPGQSLSSNVHLSAVLEALQAASSSVPASARRHALRVNVRVVPPSYPLPREMFQKPLVDEETAVGGSSVREEPWDVQFTKFIADTDLGVGSNGVATEGPDHIRARSSLRGLASKALKHRQPVLFLSYPQTASGLAAKFREFQGIKSIFFVLDYQEKDSKRIGPEAIERIRQSDLFVGIWHPEKGDKPKLSPWMHFEYGVARALDLPYCLVYCNSLPAEIVGRIDKEVAFPTYPPESFEDVLPTLAGVCVDKWQEWLRHAIEDLKRVPDPWGAS